MGEPTAPRLDAGATLAHYRVEAVVGEGAMGTVYRAHDLSLDRVVGLKVLRPEASKDERFVKRFIREARAAARLSHPTLTHIYFIGAEDDRHFFAMEFVEGKDLESVIAERGRLPVAQALDVLIQTAKGLRAAHRAGVVHRDIKPSNLLLQPDGRVRVTDFGLAKSLDANVDATHAGLVSGTPAYMSPEQCRGQPVDGRTDVYALGLTAFFLLTGRKPYESQTLGALLDQQLNHPLPSMRELCEGIPEEVEEAVRRMCAKQPAERLADMDEAVRVLEACRPRPVPPAPLATRLIAAALDLILVVMVAVLVHFGAGRFLGVPDFIDSLAGHVFLPVLFSAYHLVSERVYGATVGKWLFGLHVASRRGTRPPLRRLVPRLILRYPWVILSPFEWPMTSVVLAWINEGVQGLAILAAFVAYAVTQGRTLSDVVTRTRVTVRLAPAPPDEA